MCVQSLGQEDPLEEETATPSSIIARKIPWTEETGATAQGAAKSQTQLSNLYTHAHTHIAVEIWDNFLMIFSGKENVNLIN